jgi:hypothetical protein
MSLILEIALVRIFFATVIFFMAMLPTISFADDIYECQIKQDDNSGWIPQVVVVSVDTENKRALVFDPIINTFMGKAIEAKIDTENAKRVTFTWKIVGTKDRIGQDATFIYRLTVMKATNAASMTGTALGYAGPYGGRGSCKMGTK